MRPRGRLKNGFFPIPEEAMDGIAGHLAVRGDPAEVRILDPCAGEARGLVQLGDKLGIPRSNLYAIEMNSLRAERIAGEYPDVNLLGPCAFESASISSESFSAVYLNPPFDDEYGGGGREEVAFVRRAHWMLPPGGILILVCPFNQVFGRRDMCSLIDTWFEQVSMYIFPQGVRNYNECVVFGTKRKMPLKEPEFHNSDTLHSRYVAHGWRADQDVHYPVLGECDFTDWNYGAPVASSPRKPEKCVYPLPNCRGPKRFLKVSMTQEEIAEELAKSPLYEKAMVRHEAEFRRPPLSLNKGHTSLLLLSGLLDGLVPSDPPHVVRGHTRKVEKHMRTERHETDSGTQITKAVYAECPTPLVRAVWPDGEIRTFGEAVVTEDLEVETDEATEE